MVPLGKIFSKAWHYSLDWKRVAPFFILLVPFVILFTAFIDSAAGFFSRFGVAAAAGIVPTDLFFTLAPFFILLVAIAILVFFADLYVRGVIIENARSYYLGKKVSLKSSRLSISGRFLSLLGVAILVKIIMTGFSSIPFVGIIFALVLSWIFLVAMQSVIISKKGVFDAIRESYDLFMKKKADTFVFWLLLSIITIALFIVAMIPLVIAAWPVIAAFFSAITMGASAIPMMLAALKANLAQIFVGGLVSAFLLGFMNVFKESATTFFYIEVKKKASRR